MKIGNIDFKEREKHFLKEPGNVINEAGMAELCRLINEITRRHDRLARYLYFDEFNELFEDRWVIPKGKYSGTLPKRAANILYKEWGIKITPEETQAIGNLARDYTQGDRKYTFDITHVLDWSAGEFGDEDSCFWQGRSSAKDMIMSANGAALRFFNCTLPYEGHARCWLLPYKEIFVLINAYSYYYPYNLTLLQMSRILSVYCGLSYKRARRIINNGREDGTLYINGGTGFLIGTPEQIEKYADSTIDFGIENGPQFHCEDCGYDEGEDFYSVEDEYYVCYECWQHYEVCYECSVTRHEEDMRHTEDGSPYCVSCANHYLQDCFECMEWFDTRNDPMNILDGAAYCEECFEQEMERRGEEIT